MGKFVISKDRSGQFRFNLKAVNGQVILSSEGYTTLAACKNGVDSVKKNAPDDKRYERLMAKSGSPYFNLKATNGQIIGTSEIYSANSGMENGIISVKNNAPEAQIVEELD